MLWKRRREDLLKGVPVRVSKSVQNETILGHMLKLFIVKLLSYLGVEGEHPSFPEVDSDAEHQEKKPKRNIAVELALWTGSEDQSADKQI